MFSSIKKLINFIKHPKENYSNSYYLRYHLFKFIVKIKNKFLPDKNIEEKENVDMFDWKLYNLHYRGELKEEAKVHTISLKLDDYAMHNNELIKINPVIKPLHDNHLLLYETILQLKPESVMELGCGNGMHLYNLHMLSPDLKLFGLDKDEKQLAFLYKSYPNLPAKIQKNDATTLLPPKFEAIADLCFTQAVIMHLHTGQTHLVALKNLFYMSKKYVILMERWKNHHFMNDIKLLLAQHEIKWRNLHFYYKICPVTNKPHIVICSNQPLNYPVLTNYEVLL